MRGDAEALFGRDWKEIHFCRDGLLLPGWRNPISPGRLSVAFWTMQMVESLKLENERLKRELEQAQEAQAAAEDRAPGIAASWSAKAAWR